MRTKSRFSGPGGVQHACYLLSHQAQAVRIPFRNAWLVRTKVAPKFVNC